VIHHLTNAKHVVVVKALRLEHGFDIGKRHFYVFSQEYLEKSGGGFFLFQNTFLHCSKGIGRWSIIFFKKTLKNVLIFFKDLIKFFATDDVQMERGV
jgi:hypothetical protein